MYKDKNEIKEIIDKYEELNDIVYVIVEMYSELNECHYDIKYIKYQTTCLAVDVEYYKWQDINDDRIYIDIELLTDECAYQNFINEMNTKISDKKMIKELNEKKNKEIEIQKAIQLLKDNGIELP